MPRHAKLIACLFVLLPSMSLTLAQEEATVVRTSLSDRLAKVKHLGLVFDEKHGGYELRVYTPEQQKRNLASLAEYRTKYKKYKPKRDEIDKQLAEAHRRPGTSREEIAAIIKARNELPRVYSIFASGVQLHDVIEVGADYLEIQRSENPSKTLLLPFSRINTIVTYKPVANEAPDNAEGE